MLGVSKVAGVAENTKKKKHERENDHLHCCLWSLADKHQAVVWQVTIIYQCKVLHQKVVSLNMVPFSID